jgi:hypothetical protein
MEFSPAKRLLIAPEEIMELRYMGFDQSQNTRCYRFDRMVKGEPTVRLTITADLALFLEHRIQIQEGPTLCAGKLAADLALSLMGTHQLTNDDLIAHLQARTIAEALKSESRGKRTHRAAEARDTQAIL